MKLGARSLVNTSCMENGIHYSLPGLAQAHNPKGAVGRVVVDVDAIHFVALYRISVAGFRADR
jgi:hypothetical protein